MTHRRLYRAENRLRGFLRFGIDPFAPCGCGWQVPDCGTGGGGWGESVAGGMGECIFGFRRRRSGENSETLRREREKGTET